jgi:hypothetical protein
VNDKPKAVEDMTIEELRAELELASKEAFDAQRKVESLLMGRAQWERDAAAAIRRSEWEKVNTYGAQSARAKARNLVQPVEGVLYRVEQLGERAGAKQVAELKQAVEKARLTLRHFAVDEATGLEGEAEAEIAQLRAFVMEQGRALHEDVSVGDLPCRCRGCALIRAMDADAPSVVQVLGKAAS